MILRCLCRLIHSLRDYREQFAFKKYFFTPILKPNDVPILIMQFTSLDHDSCFPPHVCGRKTLEGRFTNGESWLFFGHTPPRRVATKEKTLNGWAIRPWASPDRSLSFVPSKG